MVENSVELGFDKAASDFDRSSPTLPAETEQSEDKPQSRDPSPVPDADAAMPADDHADYSVEDDGVEDIVITPLYSMRMLW